ncbi:unnamed protein product [Orchesella dallaii]|uniref:Gustatory receptor n=1 Tax=Orchesella dallaii TaxID=48710 RepID=A0ABP1RVJ7_9HEXA
MNWGFALACNTSLTITPAVFVIGLHWRNPCQSTLLASWILPECGVIIKEECYNDIITNEIIKWTLLIVIKGGIFLANYLIWAAGCSSTLFCMGGLQILCIMNLHEHLKRYFDACNKEPNASWVSTALPFRKIQILSLLNNNTMQTAVLMFSITMMLLTSLSITVFVRLEWNAKNFLALAYFYVMFWDCILFITVCMGDGMLSVYVESKRILDILKRNEMVTSNGIVLTQSQRLDYKWFQRFRRSCPTIRIKLGGSNFLEELTPLKCLHLASELTVDGLLLFK